MTLPELAQELKVIEGRIDDVIDELDEVQDRTKKSWKDLRSGLVMGK